MDKFGGRILKIDDLKFEKSDRKSSFFYGEKKELSLEKENKKSDIEKFLDRVFAEGLERNCSDIHIEPFSSFLFFNSCPFRKIKQQYKKFGK